MGGKHKSTGDSSQKFFATCLVGSNTPKLWAMIGVVDRPSIVSLWTMLLAAVLILEDRRFLTDFNSSAYLVDGNPRAL